MSTGYSWEGIRQVRATLLVARHVPERLCGGYVMSTWGAISSVRPFFNTPSKHALFVAQMVSFPIRIAGKPCGGLQVLMTDDVGCLCATFHHLQRSCSMKTSVHQHGELELYSVGDIEPVEFVVH